MIEKSLLLKILNEIKGVNIDSRKIKEGELFVGLKGEKTHGALYAEEALKKGAYLSVVPLEFKNKFKNEKIIFVEDTLNFLKEIAKLKREKLKAKVIGITGSVGKTTTKFMIYHLLKKNKRKAFASPKSFNNLIGISLTILNTPYDAEYLITEVGINRKGEIEELCELVKPDIGILTKIGPSHLEGLESIEGVFNEKSKLFLYLPEDGFAIINKNSPYYEKIKTKANKVYYSLDENKVEFDGKYLNVKNKFNFSIKVPSSGMAENALCSLYTLYILKEDLPDEPFKDFEFPDLRMQIIEKNNSTIILDSYNANPISMEEAIKSASFFNKKEKYLFMGDMLELGKHSEMYHREVAHIAKANDFNGIFTYGEYSKYTSEEAEKIALFSIHYKDKGEMKTKLRELMERDALILIKGSRKMEMEKILEE